MHIMKIFDKNCFLPLFLFFLFFVQKILHILFINFINIKNFIELNKNLKFFPKIFLSFYIYIYLII